MEPKRFIGSDLRRLYDRIRRELGPDAMVIRTRSLMREGADPLTEILAAAPEGLPGLPLESQQTILQSLLARLEAEPRPLTVGDLEDLAARDALDQALPAASPPEPESEAEAAPDTDWLTGFVPGAPAAAEDIEAASANHAFSLPPGEQAPPPVEWAPRPDPLDFRHTRSNESAQASARSGDSTPALIDSLVAAGLSPGAARVVFESASWESDHRRAVAATLEQRRVRYPDEAATAIITIQGPVGAGKTTALVRMALDCLDAGREALLVAADTAHVGAREQVHAYAEATGIPVADAFDQREIAKLVAKARRGTCVFVDLPAGEWQAPRTSHAPAFNYLALPAHWEITALGAALAPFQVASFAGCVLTFSDLVTGLSPVLSAAIESRLGIAFISSGRDVSSGISVADPLTLASGMFTIRTGERTDGRLAASA